MKLEPAYDPEFRTIIRDFIRTKIDESGAHGVVLGLSGGVDSAVAAVIAAEAIGKEKVHCLIMPYDDEIDKDTVEDALELVKAFELDHQIISIKEIVDSVMMNFQDTMDAPSNRIMAMGNVKARMRMVMLYLLANQNNYLVLGTSNKSEIMVGYFTKYGDGGNDANPLGDMYKTVVYKFAEVLGIPGRILSKPPSAGLFKGQSDEEDLGMSYNELDRILHGIELGLGLEDIASTSGSSVEDAIRIQMMVLRSAHKRYLGMIPKLGLRTPGFDWRENVSLLTLFPESPEGR